MRLLQILRRGYNNETKRQIADHPNKLSHLFCVNLLSRCIEDVKVNNRSIRREKQETMTKILRVLFHYLYLSKTGQVCPSMLTIAFKIDNTLIPVFRTDSTLERAEKERAIHAAVMRVQRGVKALQDIGMIKVHTYFVNEKHEQSKKNPCFFYQLPLMSDYSLEYYTVHPRRNPPSRRQTSVQLPGHGNIDIIHPKPARRTFKNETERQKKDRTMYEYIQASFADDRRIKKYVNPEEAPPTNYTRERDRIEAEEELERARKEAEKQEFRELCRNSRRTGSPFSSPDGIESFKNAIAKKNLKITECCVTEDSATNNINLEVEICLSDSSPKIISPFNIPKSKENQ